MKSFVATLMACSLAQPYLACPVPQQYNSNGGRYPRQNNNNDNNNNNNNSPDPLNALTGILSLGEFFPDPEDLGMPDSPLSQAALVTSALPLLGIGYNVFQGDTDVSISPMLGVNVDPATGSFMPSIAANVQVGDDNPINPTINLGAQIGDNGFNAKQFGIFSGLPITPTIGTGINIGDASRGTVTGNVGANNAITFRGIRPQFGGGASIGALDFGNVMNVFGGDDNDNGGGNNNAAPYEEVVKRQPAYTAPHPTYTYQQPAAYTATTQPAYKAAPTTGTSYQAAAPAANSYSSTASPNRYAAAQAVASTHAPASTGSSYSHTSYSP